MAVFPAIADYHPGSLTSPATLVEDDRRNHDQVLDAWQAIGSKRIGHLTKVSPCYMNECIKDTPAYPLEFISRLASNSATLIIRRGPAADCIGCGIDEDDVREFLQGFDAHVSKGDCGFIHSKPTLKPPGSCSDYYQARVRGCVSSIFLKFFVQNGVLILSSFKDFDDGS